MKIRYYGHVGQVTGYGRAAEGMCMSLLAAGADLQIRALAPYDTLDLRSVTLPVARRVVQQDSFLDPDPDVVIVHTLPGDCPRVVEIAGIDKLSAIRIAYTTWECMNAPRDLVAPYRMFDQVWQPSFRGLYAFAAQLPGSVVKIAPENGGLMLMPHAFDEESLERRRRRSSTADPYRFYAIGAYTHRKNPGGVIRAFALAFERRDDVELLVQSAGTPQTQIVATLAATGFSKDQLPRIRFGTSGISNDEIEMIHASADCYVTASRGEAWNLPCFDAMLAGRHIIAPEGDDGCDAYLADTTAARYRAYRSPAVLDVRVHADGALQVQGAQGLNGKMVWAEPDLEALAGCMRAAYDARTMTLETRYDPRGRYGYKAVGALAMKYIQRGER